MEPNEVRNTICEITKTVIFTCKNSPEYPFQLFEKMNIQYTFFNLWQDPSPSGPRSTTTRDRLVYPFMSTIVRALKSATVYNLNSTSIPASVSIRYFLHNRRPYNNMDIQDQWPLIAIVEWLKRIESRFIREGLLYANLKSEKCLKKIDFEISN